MAKQQKTIEQKNYEKLQGKHELKRPVAKNCVKAFLVGGLFCTSRTGDFVLLYLFF